jgi:Galactose-1-phosphate uridyl transferase, N-terminal domain
MPQTRKEKRKTFSLLKMRMEIVKLYHTVGLRGGRGAICMKESGEGTGGERRGEEESERRVRGEEWSGRRVYKGKNDKRKICFSPLHTKTLPELTVPQIRAVIDVWAYEYTELSKLPYLNYPFFFFYCFSFYLFLFYYFIILLFIILSFYYFTILLFYYFII